MLKLGQYADSSDEESDHNDNDAPAPAPKPVPAAPKQRRSLMSSLPTPKTKQSDEKGRNITAEMAAGLAAIEATKSRKAETVKITIPGLAGDKVDDDDDDEYVSMARRARNKKPRSTGSGSLLSLLSKPSQGEGVTKRRKAVVASGSEEVSTSTTSSVKPSTSSSTSSDKAAMMVPYSMTGKKAREAVIAQHKRKQKQGDGGEQDGDDADAEAERDFMASLTGASTAAEERRALLNDGFEGVVDKSALINDEPRKKKRAMAEDEGSSGPDAGPAAYPEAAYPEAAYPEAAYPEAAYPEVAYPEAEGVYPKTPQVATSNEHLSELMTKHERRKRQRGEEGMEIIDVSGAALAGGVGVMDMRQFESEQSMYTPQSANYKAQGQEKKKNQLSYLLQKNNADKMKLAQKWASGRANASAARSRYGF